MRLLTFSIPLINTSVNYIDDFGGVEASHADALVAFQDLENLFNSLGLESSPEKDCPPSTRMVFLGLIYDTVNMTLEVPEDKLLRATELIRHWLSSPRATKSDLQSLIGKLSYICACISPGKIFMRRMLYELRRLPHKSSHFTPSSALLADLRWWNEFLPVYNGVSLLRSFPWIDTTVRFCTEACISGIGGFFDGRFFHSSYPPFIDTALLPIASLEMLAVIVSLKLWSEELRGQRLWSVPTIETLTLQSTPDANASLLFNRVCANFGVTLPVLILSFSPFICRVTRTPSLIL